MAFLFSGTFVRELRLLSYLLPWLNIPVIVADVGTVVALSTLPCSVPTFE